MKISARNLTDLVMLYAVLFQGLIVMISGKAAYSVLDGFFLSRGGGVYFVFLLVWFGALVFLRRILISPYHQIFCLWVLFCHLLLGFSQWTGFISVLNGAMGGMVPADSIGLFSRFTLLVFMLFTSWLLIYINRNGEKIL
jgi:hypothetical protein